MLRALLWKEWREQAYKIYLGLGLCAVFTVIRLSLPAFSRGFFDVHAISFVFWIDFFDFLFFGGFLYALLMGMDGLAQERQRQTLGFILAKPVAPIKFVLARFVVGSAGLFLVVFVFCAASYVVHHPAHPIPFSDTDYFKAILSLGFYTAVFLVFLPIWLIYTITLCCSAAVDNPLKAAVGGVVGFSGLIFGLAMLLSLGTLGKNVIQEFLEYYLLSGFFKRDQWGLGTDLSHSA